MRLRQAERSSRAAARAGFTLMELLVVVAILLVLVGIATPLYLGYLERSKKHLAKVGAEEVAMALELFAADPSTGGTRLADGQWDILPLKKKPPLDPWGNVYHWVWEDRDGDQVFDPVVWSYGPDGQDGTGDEISNVQDQAAGY